MDLPVLSHVRHPLGMDVRLPFLQSLDISFNCKSILMVFRLCNHGISTNKADDDETFFSKFQLFLAKIVYRTTSRGGAAYETHPHFALSSSSNHKTKKKVVDISKHTSMTVMVILLLRCFILNSIFEDIPKMKKNVSYSPTTVTFTFSRDEHEQSCFLIHTPTRKAIKSMNGGLP